MISVMSAETITPMANVLLISAIGDLSIHLFRRNSLWAFPQVMRRVSDIHVRLVS